MQKLDEKQRRRPDFRGGVPVRLLDGQEWWFPTHIPHRGPDLEPDALSRLSIDEARFYAARAAFLDRINYGDPVEALQGVQDDTFVGPLFDMIRAIGAGQDAPAVQEVIAVGRAKKEAAKEVIGLFFRMANLALAVNYDVVPSDLTGVLFLTWDSDGDPEKVRIGRQVPHVCIYGTVV